jgi:phosphatidate cytidylyltransferase
MSDEHRGFLPPDDEHDSVDDPTEAVRIIGPDETGEPPLAFRPEDTGQLPHWTSPPTGEVPRIFSDVPDATEDDLAAWQSLGAQAPVWRDDRTGEVELSDPDFAPLGEGTRLGALDEAGPTDDPFDTLGEQPSEAPRVTPIRTRGARGAAATTTATRPARNSSQGSGLPADMGVRVLVGAGLGVLALILFWLGPAYTMVLVVAIVIGAAAELLDGLRRVGYQPATLLALAAVAAAPLAGYWRGDEGVLVVTFLAVVATFAWFLFSGGVEASPLPNTAVTLLTVLYVGVLGSYAALILKFPNGIGTIITLSLAVVANDVGALFVGRGAGRTPLPGGWISPQKTVEGMVGGAVGTLLVVILVNIGGLTPWDGSFLDAVKLAIVIIIAAPLGDLAESMLKRDLGVKDMGTILPGHGGILDRFDAFLFVLPAVYYTSRVLGVF